MDNRHQGKEDPETAQQAEPGVAGIVLCSGAEKQATVKGMETKDTKSTTMKKGPDEESKKLNGKRAKRTNAKH